MPTLLRRLESAESEDLSDTINARSFQQKKKNAISETPIQVSFKSTHKVILATGSVTIFLSLIFLLGWKRRSSPSKSRKAERVSSILPSGRLGISGMPSYFQYSTSETSSTSSDIHFPVVIDEKLPEGVSDLSSESSWFSDYAESDLSTKSYYSDITLSTLTSNRSNKSKLGMLSSIVEEDEEPPQRMRIKFSEKRGIHSLIGYLPDMLPLEERQEDDEENEREFDNSDERCSISRGNSSFSC